MNISQREKLFEEDNEILFIAVKNSQEKVVKYLLKKGFNPEEFIDEDMNTSLHYLCSRPYIKASDRRIFNLLANVCNIEAVNIRGETPLFIALKNIHSLKLNKGKDFVDILVENHCYWNDRVIELIKTSESAKNKFQELLKKKRIHLDQAVVYAEKIAPSKPRQGHTLNSIGVDQVLMFGGYNPRVKKTAKNYYSAGLYKFDTQYKTSNKNAIGGWKLLKNQSKTKPSGRCFHTCCRFENKLYIFGGETQRTKASTQLWIYSIDKNTWSKWKPASPEEEIPPGLSKHSAAIVFKRKYDPWKFVGDRRLILKRILEYKEFEIDQTGLKSLPDAPNVVENSQQMVIYGGQHANSRSSSEVWIFDFKLSKWHKRGEGPPPRRGHSAVFFPQNETIIIFGGFSHHSELLSETWSYSTEENECVLIDCYGKIPTPRTGHSAIIQNDRMYVFGGHDGDNLLNDLYFLNLKSNCWTRIELSKSIPPRWNVQMDFLNESEPIIVGGKNGEVNLLHLPPGSKEDFGEEEDVENVQY